MEYLPREDDNRLDNRSARFHARVMKEDLAPLPYVPNTTNRDINIARADNYVTWDYDKDMWCSVDHLMMHFYIKATTDQSREVLEDMINRDVVRSVSYTHLTLPTKA